jgi:cell division protein FtsB
MRKPFLFFLATAVAGSAGYLYYLKLKRDSEDRKAKQLKLEFELQQMREEVWGRRIMLLKLSVALLSIGYSAYYVRKLVMRNN